MAKIAMSTAVMATHKGEKPGHSYEFEVEIEVESDVGEDPAAVGIALAGAIAAVEAAEFGIVPADD